MIGTALKYGHDLFQVIVAIMHGEPVRSRLAWVRFQRAATEAKEAARERHGRVSDVYARQKAKVEAALAARVSR